MIIRGNVRGGVGRQDVKVRSVSHDDAVIISTRFCVTYLDSHNTKRCAWFGTRQQAEAFAITASHAKTFDTAQELPTYAGAL
jgi:hypothetical protein